MSDHFSLRVGDFFFILGILSTDWRNKELLNFSLYYNVSHTRFRWHESITYQHWSMLWSCMVWMVVRRVRHSVRWIKLKWMMWKPHSKTSNFPQRVEKYFGFFLYIFFFCDFLNYYYVAYRGHNKGWPWAQISVFWNNLIFSFCFRFIFFNCKRRVFSTSIWKRSTVEPIISRHNFQYDICSIR